MRSSDPFGRPQMGRSKMIVMPRMMGGPEREPKWHRSADGNKNKNDSKTLPKQARFCGEGHTPTRRNYERARRLERSR